MTKRTASFLLLRSASFVPFLRALALVTGDADAGKVLAGVAVASGDVIHLHRGVEMAHVTSGLLGEDTAGERRPVTGQALPPVTTGPAAAHAVSRYTSAIGNQGGLTHRSCQATHRRVLS